MHMVQMVVSKITLILYMFPIVLFLTIKTFAINPLIAGLIHRNCQNYFPKGCKQCDFFQAPALYIYPGPSHCPTLDTLWVWIHHYDSTESSDICNISNGNLCCIHPPRNCPVQNSTLHWFCTYTTTYSTLLLLIRFSKSKHVSSAHKT